MLNNCGLRLLMVTELFLPTKGGTAVSFDDDFRRLGEKDVHIITADVPGAGEFDCDHPNSIHRLVLKRCKWVRPESLFIYIKLFIKSLWLTVSRRISTIYAGRALPEGLVALVVARLTRRPVFIYAHGEELTGWGRGRKFQAMCFTMRNADGVLSNSDKTRDTLIELIGVEPERIELIYPTVDANRFRPGLPAEDLRKSLGLTADSKLILSVGRLMHRKGFDNVIRSLPELLKQGLDVEYAVIGVGEDLDYLNDLAIHYEVEKRVHLLGHVTYDDLPRWYNACDVFAMPNRDIDGDTEGFGLVFLEASASGKPVLAGIAGGTGSAVVDGTTGLRVDGENVTDIADALQRLLMDTELTEAMGQSARQRVLSNFTHKRRVNQLLDLAVKRSRDSSE